MNAILNVWFGGTEAGAAIADVLTGKVSPTGKLTMSFPRVTGQCPIYYNHKMTGRPMSPDAWYTRYVSNYIDVLNEPLYPFGYGLSYTTYTYGDVSLNTNSMDANGKIQALVDVSIENIDATIIAQAPKMRPYIDTMRENIARVLQIEVSQVNVKATTEEGLGFTGTGEGISSQAVCLLNTPYGLYSSDVNAGCAGCGGCPKNGIQ